MVQDSVGTSSQHAIVATEPTVQTVRVSETFEGGRKQYCAISVPHVVDDHSDGYDENDGPDHKTHGDPHVRLAG